MIPIFPKNKSDLLVINVALEANGTSSYRDALAISELTKSKWGARNIIITDAPGMFKCPVLVTKSKKEFVSALKNSISTCKEQCVLFTLSSHGYSTVIPDRVKNELNGRSEFIKVGADRVLDYELFEAFYGCMGNNVQSLCLIDTCHSGTMLDLEYLSTDGEKFIRSKTELKSRPHSVCISACSDHELAGEDVSDYAGWGGKLTCQFVDFLNQSGSFIDIKKFYRQVHRAFTSQRVQRSHPIISYND